MSSDENPDTPKRILLQTKTHLVPGDDYQERCRNMKNLLCQHLWNRDFDYSHDRWQEYGAAFAYEGRRCYFLLDHGQSTTNDVPVLWYNWTGTSFKPIEGPLPNQMLARLKGYPFIRPKRDPLQGEASPPPDAATRRQMIRYKLRSNMKIAPVELELLRNPDQVAFLKAEVDPKFWDQIDHLATSTILLRSILLTHRYRYRAASANVHNRCISPPYLRHGEYHPVGSCHNLLSLRRLAQGVLHSSRRKHNRL